MHLLVAEVAQARSEETETRTFAVTIDKKAAGDLTIQITDHDAQSQTVEVHAKVDVRFFLIRYTYQFDGIEEWKNGRLMRLVTNTDDDGTKLRVSAQAVGDQLHVRTKGRIEEFPENVWTTTYWRLPAKRDQAIPMIDADTGNRLEGTLTFVGTESVHVGNKMMDCEHYHVNANGIDVDAWYDNHHRLVRQKSREGTHTSVQTLLSIERN
jgi:hypothetical protein